MKRFVTTCCIYPEHTVSSAINWNNLPGPGDFDPPEGEDAKPLEDTVEYIEVEVDSSITVDEDGDWDFDEDHLDWAENSEDKYGEWRGETYDVFLADSADVAELACELLNPNVPADPRKYHVTADIELAFDVTNLFEDDYGYPMTDDAICKPNMSKSKISNIEIEPIFTY